MDCSKQHYDEKKKIEDEAYVSYYVRDQLECF